MPDRPNARTRSDLAGTRLDQLDLVPVKAQRNFTDPESSIMKGADGFIQAYNAQLPPLTGRRLAGESQRDVAPALDRPDRLAE